MIDFYFINSPNGRKCMMMFLELGIAHNLIRGDAPGFDVQATEFRSISANSRLPAIVDHDAAGGEGPYPVFESGAILMYLAEKTGRFLPANWRQRHDTLQWLIWQMAGQGPIHAQAHHFKRYAPDPLEPYAILRFTREAERLLYVMNRRLAKSRFLGSDDYTIADMCNYPWVEVLNVIEIDRSPLVHLDRWMNEIKARPATQEMMERFPLPPMMQKPGRIPIPPEAFSRAFGDELHRRARID